MTPREPETGNAPADGKPERMGFLAPAIIVAFIAATLAGTYFIREGLLERAMIAAMHMDDRATVAELADSFPSPVNVRDEGRRTPLHWAAARNDTALVALLLSKGADVNARNSYGETPLLEGIGNGDRQLNELLIAKGADVNAKDDAGNTVLQWALVNGRDDIAILLRQAGAKE